MLGSIPPLRTFFKNFFPPSRSFPFDVNRRFQRSQESARFLFLRDHGDLIPPRSRSGEEGSRDDGAGAAAASRGAESEPSAAKFPDDVNGADDAEKGAARIRDLRWIHDDDRGDGAAALGDPDADAVLDRRSDFIAFGLCDPAPST